MLKNTTSILVILTMVLIPALSRADEKYEHTTPDGQFLIITSSLPLLETAAPLAQHLKESILDILQVCFYWDTPAAIIIHKEKKWRGATPYYLHYTKSQKKIETFVQPEIEKNVLFPGAASLILSEIILQERKIKKIEGNTLPLPICLIEGLWRYIAGFNTLSQLKTIQNVNLSSLLSFQEMIKQPEDFYIKSASLIGFLLSLPYGNIRLRTVFVSLYNAPYKNMAQTICAIYDITDEDAFNRQWEKHIEATILSLEYEKKVQVNQILDSQTR